MLTLAAWSQVDTGPPINTSIDDPDNQRFKEDDFRMLYMKVRLPCQHLSRRKEATGQKTWKCPRQKRLITASLCVALGRNSEYGQRAAPCPWAGDQQS